MSLAPIYQILRIETLPESMSFLPMLNSKERVFYTENPPAIPKGWRLLTLGKELSDKKSVNVIECYQLIGQESVHADNYISASINKEFVIGNGVFIPAGYDEELGVFYPLGIGSFEDVIRIDILPIPSASTIRSLGGSIKIFFLQTVSSNLPFFNEQKFAVAKWDNEKNAFDYEIDLDKITNLVAKSNKVLLLLHGLFNSTQNMFIEDLEYDLILSYDYENIYTSFEVVASNLKIALERVGVTHDKGIAILAYGTGGLIARWLIEKLEFNTVVKQLFLVGTPNLGTPYFDAYEIISAFGSTYFTRSINDYTANRNFISRIDIVNKSFILTIDQMKSESDFLKDLNDGTDPNIPYTIIAGNNQKINTQQVENNLRLLRKVMSKFKQRGHYDAIDQMLFGSLNDLLASRESLTTIPNAKSRQFPLRIIECGCDHLGYFTSDEGKRALREAFSDK